MKRTVAGYLVVTLVTVIVIASLVVATVTALPLLLLAAIGVAIGVGRPAPYGVPVVSAPSFRPFPPRSPPLVRRSF